MLFDFDIIILYPVLLHCGNNHGGGRSCCACPPLAIRLAPHHSCRTRITRPFPADIIVSTPKCLKTSLLKIVYEPRL